MRRSRYHQLILITTWIYGICIFKQLALKTQIDIFIQPENINFADLKQLALKKTQIVEEMLYIEPLSEFQTQHFPWNKQNTGLQHTILTKHNKKTYTGTLFKEDSIVCLMHGLITDIASIKHSIWPCRTGESKPKHGKIICTRH